ncbi:MAG: ATP-dependent Clp protease ATP-binding subunit, partial [Planctomycetes bacterium]|nr:ATP-dependent Clp protease ATP-binding subunit [Planctomycetota bacterium]
MIHADFNLVLKYCEVLDEFIKIRVFSEEEAREIIKRASGSDKARFQREIIQACIIDYNDGVIDALAETDLNPSGIDLEEMLYLLCVEVNPGLDIHQVSVHLGSTEVESDHDPALALKLKQKNRKTLRRIANMENDLRKRVIGQDRAVEIVSRSIKKSVVGLRDPDKPVGAFLFVGQVGVGKTELAK